MKSQEDFCHERDTAILDMSKEVADAYYFSYQLEDRSG